MGTIFLKQRALGFGRTWRRVLLSINSKKGALGFGPTSKKKKKKIPDVAVFRASTFMLWDIAEALEMREGRLRRCRWSQIPEVWRKCYRHEKADCIKMQKNEIQRWISMSFLHGYCIRKGSSCSRRRKAYRYYTNFLTNSFLNSGSIAGSDAQIE
ncbi:hypothetical protein KP509_12G030400 [Ceratopteris richardii]|uniref:Uncharacterized protein n=1 Tax=Ceratopteris richardii TaxID=49495 RepID=A0A8T2THT2_CERRI|nr:hypothetical protein KP509_12G030400 [Ceratopteris richardii]